MKPVLNNNQPCSSNWQKNKRINQNFVNKNVDTDDISEGDQQVTRNNDIDILIDELNELLKGIDESNEAINNMVKKSLSLIQLKAFIRSAKTNILT